MAQIGQPALVQLTEGIYHTAIVAHVNSGDNCDLVLFSNSDWWENGAGPWNISYIWYGLDKGTGVGEWQDNPAGLGPGALVTSSSTRAVTAGTPYQPNATHDVQITCSWSLTTSGGSAGTVKLLSDENATPVTEVARMGNTGTGTLTIPFSFRVKAGDTYMFTTTNDSGTPTFALVGGTVYEQILG